MKKTVNSLFIFCVLALALTLSLASCGNKCEHTYGNACDTTCNECEETRAVSAHVYDNTCDVACNECGKTRAVNHDYSVILSDETYHWYACSVCEREDGENKVKHSFDNASDTSCSTCEKTRATEHIPSEDD